jgi:predicted RNase H-like HicB family nuclease
MLSEKRNYVAVIHKEKSSDYGVMFPDFLGCISVGKTMEEAYQMAEKALQFHIDGMIEDKEEIPQGMTLDAAKKKYKKIEALLLISVRIPSKVTRINITVDEKFLRKLDKFLETHNENRSSFFVAAAKKVMASC